MMTLKFTGLDNLTPECLRTIHWTIETKTGVDSWRTIFNAVEWGEQRFSGEYDPMTNEAAVELMQQYGFSEDRLKG
jgi:soluble lytic murein transglycosylase-like protein